MLLLLTAHAFASAYYNLDSGARAIGRGGAFVVGADDLTAQYYNPAALNNIDRTAINVDAWAINQYVRFDRADDPGADGTLGTEDDNVYGPVYNEAGWFPIPNAGAAFRLGGLSPKLKDTVVAVGMYTPTAPSMSFPASGPQRYSLIDSLVWQIFYGVSASQKLGPVTLGAGINYTVLRVNESLAMTTIPDGTTDPGSDVTLDVAAWDKNQFSWNAGIIVEPVDGLQIGASVQPAIAYEGKGSMTASFTEGHPLLPLLEGDTFTDDDIALLVTTPWVLKAGVQVVPSDAFRIEGDFTYTTWSQLENLIVRPCAEEGCTDGGMLLTHKEGGFLTEDIPITADVAIPTGFQDAISVRVGGDLDVASWLQLRAGANYESSAVPSRLQGVSVVDGTKFGLGLGATARVAKRWAFDLGIGEQFILGRDITDSEFKQITLVADASHPEDTTIGAGLVVGNGQFASRLTYAGIGATVYLGGNPASTAP
jgi:long-chain fatty acid transport protein